jgi:serine/threonine protein kinase
MAPEQASGATVDARCDLFSLGSVLYQAATGKAPFGDRDTLSILNALATQTPPPPHKIVASLPRLFSGLAMRLLAKDPADRPQTAREVVEAIEGLERGEKEAKPFIYPPTETAPPPAPPAEKVARKPDRERPKHPRGYRKKTRPEVKKPRGRWLLAAGAAVLVVAFLVLLFALLRPRPAEVMEQPDTNAGRPADGTGKEAPPAVPDQSATPPTGKASSSPAPGPAPSSPGKSATPPTRKKGGRGGRVP